MKKDNIFHKTMCFHTEWCLESIYMYGDLVDFVPTWDEKKQIEYILYTATRLPQNIFVFWEKTPNTRRYIILDGKERLWALKAFEEGRLVIKDEDLPSGELGELLKAAQTFRSDEDWTGDSDALYFSLHDVPTKCVILRSATQEVVDYVQRSLTESSIRKAPTFENLCQMVESITYKGRKVFHLQKCSNIPLSCEYYYNPSPGVVGRSFTLQNNPDGQTVLICQQQNYPVEEGSSLSNILCEIYGNYKRD